MLWSVFQAVVMLVQNRYQRRRMYTRIALGKNSAMDVVSGESSGTSGQLLLLYPMLFCECLCACVCVRGVGGGLVLGVCVSVLWVVCVDVRAHCRLAECCLHYVISTHTHAVATPLDSLPTHNNTRMHTQQTALQAWQLVLGAKIALRTWPAMLSAEGWLEVENTQSDLRGMRGSFVLGCAFACMAMMNFLNTIATITDKRRYRKSHTQQQQQQQPPNGDGAAAAKATGSGAAAKKK
jgi:cytochrome c biogenesis protein CcdA